MQVQFITFIWSGVTFQGEIVSQEPSAIFKGQNKTIIKCTEGTEFTMYGKCQVGDCGPFKVLSIENKESILQ